ncbi:MAG TPA: zinc-binding dehydrogenase [Jatrophihabitantaceae bacterium]|nr:zinc-binding dehydrogenase [Jatrophihabitantaceae bacterium]
MRAVQITVFGGPEVLQLTELPDPRPAPGQTLIDVNRSGINYADTHHVENSYLTPAKLPLVPGAEVAGRTADGRRVVALVGEGGYAERALAPDNLTFDIPEGTTDGQALALVSQGLTAWHLLRTSTRMADGETVVVHAAAGGVGSLLVQLAKRWGAGRVIATASTEGKRQLALDLGADVALDGSPDRLNDRLREANEGRGVDIVLEMVGGPVFDASIAALGRFGRIAFYGMASRTPPTPVEPARLMARSQSVIGFWLVDCLRQAGMLAEPLAELFELTAAGELRPVIGGEYGLSEVAAAHRALRSRSTIGKLLLDPSR